MPTYWFLEAFIIIVVSGLLEIRGAAWSLNLGGITRRQRAQGHFFAFASGSGSNRASFRNFRNSWYGSSGSDSAKIISMTDSTKNLRKPCDLMKETKQICVWICLSAIRGVVCRFNISIKFYCQSKTFGFIVIVFAVY